MGWLTNGPFPRPHVPQTEGPQISDHRLSILCGVVERPDHHCGDDLVRTSNLVSVLHFNICKICALSQTMQDSYIGCVDVE